MQAFAVESEGQIYASATRPSSPRRRRRTNTPTYTVRHGPRGERLVEHRPGSEKDFYVTRTDYDAAIKALAQTATPDVRFDQLHKAFLAAGGSPTKSAYPLRVVLRYLRNHQPPLVMRRGGGYSLTAKTKEFRQEAERLWDRGCE
ncbi:hypothetical protein ACERK3_19420 [Phycisphaerales bacterium AB-hyl4]|uniref:Uncharacterized protein n=1 Tax=Natronomicrosphaera hydrolytica TaxID=3242702 RepID=A0ABV4UCS0_9BACT